jgi:hypothetical protein
LRDLRGGHRAAGYEHPQFSVHRGELQGVLLSAATSRLGADRLILDHTCTGATQDEDVISLDELRAISDRYKTVAGFSRPALERQSPG